MAKWVIQGGNPLRGKVKIRGSRKSILAIIPATILASSPCIIDNVPQMKEVRAWIKQLNEWGISASVDGSTIIIDPRGMDSSRVWLNRNTIFPDSIYWMGALLGRKQKFIFEPHYQVDTHLKKFQALGAQIEENEGKLYFSPQQLTGNQIYLDINDAQLTMNLMLASVRAQGTTVIKNAAKDPEVVDLAIFLGAMGANIFGAGTDTIRIEGNNDLIGCRHTIIPDRFEAGMYMIFAAATRGQIEIHQLIPTHLKSISAKLREMGADVREDEESVVVTGRDAYHSIDIKTLPYPGFPVELQLPFTSLLTQARGTSLVTEHFPRFHFEYVSKLQKMGARIKVAGRTVIIQGVTPLTGKSIVVNDVASGTALLVASLIASNVTLLSGTEMWDYGYENLINQLVSLGAEIQKRLD